MEKNLAAFLAVARENSLTEASDALAVTQPSVTKRIANLEADLGVPLFVRHRRGMRLTEAGKVLFEHACRIEDEYRYCRESLSAMSSAGLAVLRVGAGPLFHLNCVASLFSDLKTRFKQLKLELIANTRQEIGTALAHGEIDLYLGVLDNDSKNLDGIDMITIAEVEHGIVLRPDHPVASQNRIDVCTLADHQWVIFGTDPRTEGRIRSLVETRGHTPWSVDVRTSSFATGLQMVKDGPFVMSAPLQLASRVKNEGLVILPTEQGMPHRSAGVHFRQSALGFGVVKAALRFFEDFEFT